MSLPRFIQIHTLHTYPAALLNRDDAGLAKRLPYGARSERAFPHSASSATGASPTTRFRWRNWACRWPRAHATSPN